MSKKNSSGAGGECTLHAKRKFFDGIHELKNNNARHDLLSLTDSGKAGTEADEDINLSTSSCKRASTVQLQVIEDFVED